MLPLTATALVAVYGDIYYGLWYPIIVSVITLVIGMIFLKDTKGVDISTSSGVANQTS
jgi:preprotein translocase subunit SecG